jgi:hypothetical protein
MKPALAVYDELKKKVTLLYQKLKLFRYKNTVGRTLALPIIETLTLALYKQTQNIATKKAIWRDFQPPCSYKTLVVNMNRCVILALLVLCVILRLNRLRTHIVKHTDSEVIPREVKPFAALAGPDRADACPDLLALLVFARGPAMVENICSFSAYQYWRGKYQFWLK